MVIHIENLTVDVIIGILDYERTSKQKVVVETTINYFYTKNKYIDYIFVIDCIKNLLIKEEYMLLEDAINDIGNRLIREFPQINSLHLKISKPNAVENCSVAMSKEWK